MYIAIYRRVGYIHLTQQFPRVYELCDWTRKLSAVWREMFDWRDGQQAFTFDAVLLVFCVSGSATANSNFCAYNNNDT